MAKKTKIGDPERIFDWSGGMNNAVNPALLNDNESVLLENYTLDEKGTLFPAKGGQNRYASPFGSSPVAGMGAFYKSDGTSRLLAGTEDGKLYVDTPHLISQWDTQGEFNGGTLFGVVSTSDGKLWPLIVSTGFEDGYFADFHTRDSGWTIDDTVYKSGTKSAKGTGTTQKLIREFGFNASQVYIKLACRFAETNQVHYPVIFKSPTDTEIQAVVADADGNFKYHNGTALTAFPVAKAYAANTWYVVEVWVRGGTFWVSIDGVSLIPSGLAMKDTANAAQSRVAKVQIQNAGSTAATMWVDDVVISLLDPAFSRSSVAYKSDGTQVAANQPRYEYHALPYPVWQDTFDTDQLATQYTSGGDSPATWTVSNGVLTGTGGIQATLIKKNLTLQDCDIVVNSDQAHYGGIVARYQDNNNYYLLQFADDSGGINNLRLYKRVGGTYTILTPVVDVTWTRGTSKSIKFTLRGSLLEAWFDGIKVISVTDTTFSGGGVGLYSYTGGVAVHFLDFTVYYAQQGVMMEGWTANLVKTNAGADPLFNSTTGWLFGNATIANGVLTLQSPDGSVWSAATCTLTNLAQNTRHSFLIRARYKDTTGTAGNLHLDLYGTGYDNAEQELDISTNQLTTAFQNFKKDGFDSQAAPSSVQLRIFTYSTRPIEVEYVQLEQKPYATTVMDGSREAEVTTVPTAGVFQKGNWTVKLRYTPTSATNQGNVEHFLFRLTIDANNDYRFRVGIDGRLYFGVCSNGTWYTAYGDPVLSPGNTYYISASGNGSTLRLFVNGAQVGADTFYVEPVGALPALMYVGSYQTNGIISDFAVMNKAQTLAEHQAEYQTGLPLAWDVDTTYLMPCDGNLNLPANRQGVWVSPVIDASNAVNKASGCVALTADTPGGSTVSIQSRSAPASTGPWTDWVNALMDGTLQHPANNYVQVRLILKNSGTDDPDVDKLVVSFDGQAVATLLASDFTAEGQFFFGQLTDYLAVVNGLDAPRKYDGATLALIGGSPPHASYVAAHKNRLWLAKGSRLYFSDLLNIDSWPVLNFIDIMPQDGDTITGLLVYGDYLIITKQRSVWMLTGDGINTFSVRRIHADRGAYAPRSLCIVNQMLCFISDDGIYFSDFTQPVLISERVRQTWAGLNKRRLNLVASWFAEHKLYVAVPEANSQRNSMTIVYDTLRQAFAGIRRDIKASCFCGFREAGEMNTLFGRSDTGQVMKLNAGYSNAGQAYTTDYRSKEFSFGAPEVLKRFNVVYLQVKPASAPATLTISFIVDGRETQSMDVAIPADTEGMIHTLLVLASKVGVVAAHRLGIRIRQSVLDNPVGIQTIYIESMPVLLKPTIRG